MTRPGRPRRPTPGFTLLSVLVAMIVLGIGLLAIMRTFVGVTSASTQNETLSSVSTLSNAFWSAMQYTPKGTVVNTFPGTYDLSQATTITGAPTNLQPFLTVAEQTLPTPATATVSVSSTTCSTDCQLTLTLTWTQVGSGGLRGATTRSQVFYYALP